MKVNRGVVKKMKYDYEGLGRHTWSKHRMGERNNREIEREKKDKNWGNYTKGKLI